ncbi:hypothetical protein PsYK624_033050 [Phanerochaete sordida]|uniref:Uncharacterized protein n=1 Tax=Phanerochaete sordida TaxID=48140 RepID=A0A9P3LAW6_9APHY|nr:hypothetical protein PsYK624_033050 [Phanerochaete sordida]
MAGTPDLDTDASNLSVFVSLIGTSVSQSLVQVVTESITFGIYTALFVCALVIIPRSPPPLRPQKVVLLVVCLVMYALATAHLGTTLYRLFEDDRTSKELRALALACTAGLKSTTSSQQCAAALAGYDTGANTRFAWASGAPVLMNGLLSDIVVVWRAWVLWPRSRAVQIVSVLFLLAYTAMSVWSLAVHHTGSRFSASPVPVPLAAWLANLWALGLVGIRAWQNRQRVRAHLCISFRTSTERVLLLIVESGVLYCVFLGLITITGVLNFLAAYVPALVAFRSSSLSRAFDVIEAGCLIDITGMYPTVVILLVELSNNYAQRALSVNDVPTLPLRCTARARPTLGADGIAMDRSTDKVHHVRLPAAVRSSAAVVESAEKAGESWAEKPGHTQKSM